MSRILNACRYMLPCGWCELREMMCPIYPHATWQDTTTTLRTLNFTTPQTRRTEGRCFAFTMRMTDGSKDERMDWCPLEEVKEDDMK